MASLVISVEATLMEGVCGVGTDTLQTSSNVLPLSAVFFPACHACSGMAVTLVYVG
jgi:hypothetical protein